MVDQIEKHRFGHILYHYNIPGSGSNITVVLGPFEFINISGNDHSIQKRLIYKVNCYLVNYKYKREPNTP